MPQPEGPSSVKSSPSATVRSTRSTAVTAPKRLVTPWIPMIMPAPRRGRYFFSSSHLASMSERNRVLSASDRLAATSSS